MNIAELKELALLIKQETVEEANSSLRIGTAFEEVVKKLGLNEDEISELRGMVGGGGSSSGHSIISATPPENPSNGDHWTSTITYIDYTYVGGAWIEL